MKRLPLLALVLLAACDKPAPPVDLTLKSTGGDYGHWSKVSNFTLEGPGCSAITLSLFLITSKDADRMAHHVFRGPSARGSFSLLEQHGEPFDRPGQIYFELQHAIPASNQSLSSSPFPILQGPFPAVSQQVITDGPLSAGVDTVVFARCMSEETSRAFSWGSIEDLKKHVAGTKDIVVAIVVRWDR